MTSNWATYILNDIFPATSGLTLGTGADDALYLQVQMPLSVTCNINFTKPSIFLTQGIIPTNDFQTYDQVDAVINSPRTGDIRMSLNGFYPYGWVPLNDGTIGNTGSNPSILGNISAWPLFKLIWSNFSNYSNSTTNLLAQLYDSSGTPVAYGVSAIADWNANRGIALTRTMGKVILGSVPFPALLPTYKTSITVSSNVVTTGATAVNFFNGMPVYFIGTTTLSTKLIYYVSSFNGVNNFFVSTSFANALAGVVVTVASDSGTIVSALAGASEGEYAHTQLVAELATHTHTASGTVALGISGSSVSGPGTFSPVTAGPTTVAVTVNNTGSSTPFNITQPGTFYNMFMKL